MLKWIVPVVALLTLAGASFGETATPPPGSHGDAPPVRSNYTSSVAPQQDPNQKLFQMVSACMVDRPASASKVEDVVRSATRSGYSR